MAGYKTRIDKIEKALAAQQSKLTLLVEDDPEQIKAAQAELEKRGGKGVLLIWDLPVPEQQTKT